MKSNKLLSALIVAVALVLSTSIYSFRDQIKKLFIGPDIQRIRIDHEVYNYNIDKEIRENYDAYRDYNKEVISFSDFKKDFYSSKCIFRCFRLNADIILIPEEVIAEFKTEFPEAVQLSLCIHQRDTMLVEKERVYYLKKDLPEVKIIH